MTTAQEIAVIAAICFFAGISVGKSVMLMLVYRDMPDYKRFIKEVKE